jgi:peptide/nickel transport system permease protein
MAPEGVAALPVALGNRWRARGRHPVLRAMRPLGFSGVVVAAVVACALVPNLVAPANPNGVQLLARFVPPFGRTTAGAVAVLGTDELGRDILSRLIYGARTSMLIGAAAVLFAGSLGTALGLTSAIRGGLVDSVIMRIADMQFAFPFILLAITVIGVFGQSIQNVILVVGLSNWVAYARVVRAEALAVRERTYVEAARALGMTLPRVVWRHVFPNVCASLIVIATFGMASSVLAEAGLSFLGLGVPLSIPSWGGMLADGRQYLDTEYWLSLFPGVALFLTVLAVNLLGDGLRDALDPYAMTRKAARRL